MVRGIISSPAAAPSGDFVAVTMTAITRFIRENALKPGDRLPAEAVLTKELHVSRTVVREALRSLSALRLVDLGAGKRPTVAQLDDETMAMMMAHGVTTDQIGVQHIYDARRTIEGRAAALAALRWHGYRSENRYTVFQCLAHTVNWPAPRWRVLDLAHQKRNRAEYEGFLEAEESAIAELCALVEELIADSATLIEM